LPSRYFLRLGKRKNRYVCVSCRAASCVQSANKPEWIDQLTPCSEQKASWTNHPFVRRWPLQAAGYTTVDDLAEAADEELAALGLKVPQIRRLRKAIQGLTDALRATPTRYTDVRHARARPPSTPPRSPARGWHPLEHTVAAEALQAALASFEIFLSYRRSRSGDARALKMALVELGHRVFFDVDRDEGLGVGNFQAQLEAVLADTPVLLVLVTPAPSGPPGDWREHLSSMEVIAACAKSFAPDFVPKAGGCPWPRCTDYCRLEIANALAAGKLVVSVYPGSLGPAWIGHQLRHLQGLEGVEALMGMAAYPILEDMYTQSVGAISTAIRRHQRLPRAESEPEQPPELEEQLEQSPRPGTVGELETKPEPNEPSPSTELQQVRSAAVSLRFGGRLREGGEAGLVLVAAEVRGLVRGCLGEDLEHVECRLPSGAAQADGAADGSLTLAIVLDERARGRLGAAGTFGLQQRVWQLLKDELPCESIAVSIEAG
jgi:hypothetical protein